MPEGNSVLLPASARDQTVARGGMFMMRLMLTLSAWHVFFFQTVFFFLNEESYITNLLMTDPSGKVNFVSLKSGCFIRFLGNKIHCFPWDQ